MEEQENLTPSQMLALIQGLLVNNSRAIENLESAVTELDLSRDKSKDDLNSHYARVCTMLNEVYKTSIEEVATQHDKKKGDLKRKKKQLTRSSLALVPELANLRSGGTDADDAVSRCKQILAKLTEDVGLEKIDGRVSFNFIPKLRKLKLGFLQLCNNLPEDFALRLLTPIMNIRLGQQIRCGIEGNFTAENVRHLEFGIRRDNDFVPSRNLGTEGKVFNFGFTADLGGVYVILACLFGNPIAHSPLTLTIHESGPRITNDDVLASHIEVSSDAIGLKASEEEDADKISSSVQDAGSVKASTKAVKGNEEKSSSMALEKPKPYQQIKDDHKAAVPFIIKTVIPQRNSFGDIGDQSDPKDSREKAEHIKTEESLNGALSKKRRNKCKPPAPRPLKSKSKPPEPKSLESKSKPPEPKSLESKSKPPEPKSLESKSKPPAPRSLESSFVNEETLSLI